MYKVYIDGTLVFNDEFPERERTFLDPNLTLTENSAGSFTFSITPQNVMYGKIKKLISRVRITRRGEEIWSGRPIQKSGDFWTTQSYTCEGELAYLNDSYQPQGEFHNMTVRGFLEHLLEVHNQNVEEEKKFYVGEVTVTDPNDSIYRYTNYENTIECINSKLIDSLGGHLRIRKVDGKRYLDYLEEYPVETSQKIEFGVNLINYTDDIDSIDFATVIIPLGAQIEEDYDYSESEDYYDVLQKYTTIESVNGGVPYVKSDEAVAEYGWIEKVVHFDDVYTPAYLKVAGLIYLAESQFDEVTIQIEAVDLNYLNVKWQQINLLDTVRVVSPPHGLDKQFPVTELQIPLNQPENTVFTLGTTQVTSISGIHSDNTSKIQNAIRQIPSKKSILEQAKENAAQILNQKTNGHITITSDEYGSNELLVTDDKDYTKAVKMWKWNLNGLGYSKDGGQTYETAITMDGTIMGKFIAAGTITADQLNAGVTTYLEQQVTDALGDTYWGESEVTSAIRTATDSINLSVDSKVKGIQNNLLKNTRYPVDTSDLESSGTAPNQIVFDESIKENVFISKKIGTGTSMSYICTSRVKLKPGKEYTLGFDFYRETGVTSMYCSMRYIKTGSTKVLAGKGEFDTSMSITGIPAVYDQWTRFTKTFTAPEDADSAYFVIYGYLSSGTEAFLRVTSLKLEEGNIATRWGICPYDLVTNSSLSVTKDAILSSVESLTNTKLTAYVQKSEIEQLADSITLSVMNEVVGGDNLLTNTRNPQDCTTLVAECPLRVDRGYVGEQYRNGFTAEKMSSGNFTTTIYTSRATVSQGKTYTFSFDLLQCTNLTRFTIGMYYSTSPGRTGTESDKMILTSLTDTTIGRKAVTFELPNDGVIYSAYISLFASVTDSAESINLLINSLKLEEGNAATPWNPSPYEAGATYAAIKVTADAITSCVRKGELGTTIRQSATDIQIAWNNICNQIDIESDGLWLTRSSTKVGKIGTNEWHNDSSVKGLVFDLNAYGSYMCWGAKNYESDEYYYTRLLYAHSSFDDYISNHLYVSSNAMFEGRTRFENPAGFRASVYAEDGSNVWREGLTASGTVYLPADTSMSSWYECKVINGIVTDTGSTSFSW